MALFNGSGVAMVTPMTTDSINYEATEKLIEHIISGGTSALFVLGTTGEPSTLSLDEKLQFLEFCVKKVDKRIKIYAGSGGNNTPECVNFSVKCESLGVDGLLVVTPYYNKCTQNGLVAHFKAISDAVNIPIIVYNVPGRTGLNVLPETFLKLAQLKNVKGIKEASGNIDQLSEVARLTRGKLDLYSGDDSLTVVAMSLGALGVISVAANIIPSTISKLCKLCQAQDFVSAREIQFTIAPFVKTLFSEVNPIPAKKALEFIGIDAGAPRLPLTEMEPAHAEIMKAELEKLRIDILTM